MSNPLLLTSLLLIASNVFMTFAWYGHLKNLAQAPRYVAALVSWGIAQFEYLLQVPANRIGYTALSLGQLKILQGSDYFVGVRPFRRAVYEPAAQAGLPVCRRVFDGRGVFYFS